MWHAVMIASADQADERSEEILGVREELRGLLDWPAIRSSQSDLALIELDGNDAKKLRTLGQGSS